MKKIIVLFLLLTLSTHITWAGPGHDHDHGESVSGGSSKYPIVTVVRGKTSQDDLQTIEVSGTVLPERFTDIHPIKGGIIESFSVNIGDYVQRGQVIAVMKQDLEQRALVAQQVFIEKEIEILSEKSNLLVGNQFSLTPPSTSELQNAIQDVLFSVADVLYLNPSFLNREEKIFSPSPSFRRYTMVKNSVRREKILTLEKEFLPLYYSFKESGRTQTNSFVETTFNIGTEAREVVNAVNLETFKQKDREELLELKKDLGEAVERLSSVIEETVTIRNEQTDINFSLAQQKADITSSLAEKKAEVEKIKYQNGYGRYVTAPFSGYITERHINIGDPVGPESPLFSLVDNNNRFVRFQVPQETLPFIEKDKEILFASAYAPLKKEKAVIKRISPSVDPTNQMVLIEAETPGKGSDMPHILSHMNVRVFIPLVSGELAENTLVIPLSALEISKSSSFVWTVNKAVEIEKKKIEVSFIYEDKAYVSKDLGKAWVVIKTPVKLKEDLEVDSRLP